MCVLVRALMSLRTTHGRLSQLRQWVRRSLGENEAGVRPQIGLKLHEVHTEGTIQMQGGSDGGHSLASEPVLVGIARVLNCPCCHS